MLTRYNTCVLVGMRGDSTFLFPFSEKVTNADNRTPALTGAPRARLGHGYGDLKNGDPLPSYQPSTTRKILWRYEYKYERTAVVSPCCARVMSIAYYRKCRSDTKPPASRLPAAARACFFFSSSLLFLLLFLLFRPIYHLRPSFSLSLLLRGPLLRGAIVNRTYGIHKNIHI